MTRLFFVLILVVAGVVGLGFYLGWFQVASEGTDGKTHITLTVNKDKIQADEKTVLDKVHGTDKATAPAEKGADQALPPVQPSPNQN